MTAGTLSHRFRRLGQLAQVSQPALHRLRHGVATHLVDNGKLLKAQARLGHRDPSTTLRHYSHTSLLDDQDVADELDAVLNSRGDDVQARYAELCALSGTTMINAEGVLTSHLQNRLGVGSESAEGWSLGRKETEVGITSGSLLILAGEHRDLGVDVVVDEHLGLARYRSEDPPDVLDDAAFELDRKRQKNGVEAGAVEAFTDEA